MMKLTSTTCLLLLFSQSSGFSPLSVATSTRQKSPLLAKLSTNEDESPSSSIPSSTSSSRRDFFAQSVSMTGAAAVLAGMSTGGMGIDSWFVRRPETEAWAVSGSNKVNAKLKAYGLPPISKVPDGLTPLLEIYGKGKNRFPLLVTFCYPLTWVVTLPSNDVNGEDGTIQAGEYAKGDTATFFLYTEPGHIDNIQTAGKEVIEKALIKSISQKGDNMYQNFKITKVEPYEPIPGEKHVVVDFKYQLLTGAGFEVDRKGVASLTSQGPAVEVLWTASTAVRYKKTESQLRDIVSTFRCYADGLNLSEEVVRFEDS